MKIAVLLPNRESCIRFTELLLFFKYHWLNNQSSSFLIENNFMIRVFDTETKIITTSAQLDFYKLIVEMEQSEQILLVTFDTFLLYPEIICGII